MTKSATEIMQEIMAAAMLDAIGALKAASKGLPNTLLRDINAIHANTTLADLPPEVQASIAGSVRAAFTRLLKEGYAVSPAGSAPPRPQRPTRDGDRPAPGPRRSGPPPDRERRPGPRPPRPDRDGRPAPPRGPRPDRGKPRGK